MCSDAGVDEAILSGDARTVEARTRRWLTSGHSIQEFQEAVLRPAIEAIRQQFAKREFYLPELLVSLRAAKAAVGVLDAAGRTDQPRRGKVVVGSLAWNGHGFSRNVVVDLLEVCGWDVVDLGEDVSPVRFADVCVETCASVLVVTALSFSPGRLSSVVANQEIKSLLEEMDSRGIRKRMKILLVGFVSDSLLQSSHELDAICDDLVDVVPTVHQLAGSGCA